MTGNPTKGKKQMTLSFQTAGTNQLSHLMFSLLPVNGWRKNGFGAATGKNALWPLPSTGCPG